MQKIEISLKLRPMTYPVQYKNVKVSEKLNGPHAVSCECGNNFAAFKMDTPREFDAFLSAIQMAARRYMMRNGIIRPLAGSLSISITVGCKRPLSHYDKEGLLPDYRYRVPMKLPAFYRIEESVCKCLHGVAFMDMKQLSKSSFARVYRDQDCFDVVIQEVNPSDVDPDIKQLELF